MTTTCAPETKSTADYTVIVDDLKSAFEIYKEENDRTLAEMKHRGSADVVSTDKLARIDRALDDMRRRQDDLALRVARPTSPASVSARAPTPNLPTSRLSTAISARVRRPVCSTWKKRRYRSVRTPTVGISCRRKPKPPSTPR